VAIFAFLVYFYTVFVIGKKTKFSTKSPRKYGILTHNSKKNFWVEDYPSLGPSSCGEGDTPTHPSPFEEH